MWVPYIIDARSIVNASVDEAVSPPNHSLYAEESKALVYVL